MGRFYSKLDWDLMAFFACLFAVIYTMEHAQVLVIRRRVADSSLAR